MTEALDSARKAWASDDLGSTDEQAIWSRYGNSFTARTTTAGSNPCCSPRTPTMRRDIIR